MDRPAADGPAEVITLGETMAMIVADDDGPIAHARSLALSVGGAESNVAVALARLEVPVVWVGRVGADGLGEKVLRELRAERVEVVAVVDPGAPTGLMIKERRTHQHLQVSYYRAGSAGSRMTPDDLPVERIGRASLLHVSGITPALSATAAATLDAAVTIAADAEVPVSLDVNYRSRLWTPEQAAPVLAALAARCDLVFGGDDEAALLVGADASVGAAELAERVAALGPAEVVLKRGAAGAYALVDGAVLEQPAVPVTVVDTVGAGDAFVAGYLAEWLAGRPVQDRLSTAVRAGAFACLVRGDWEGSPRRDELELLDATEPVRR